MYMAIIVSVMPKWRFDTSSVELPQQWDFHFINPATAAELTDACRQADCLLVPASFPEINAPMLRQLSHIKLIQTVGAGYDLIDCKAAAELGIPVANVPGANANSVAEFTVGLVIALQRQLLTADRETKAGQYAAIRQSLLKTGLNEIAGSLVGLVGLGAIGRQVARILKFLGASVCYYSRSGRSVALETELGITYKPLQELLATSNIVSVHVPLTADTQGLIGRYELGLMSPGSLLVNTARGEVIDQQALAEMLETGHIGGAAVDVVSPEPPPQNHPLLTLSPEARDRLLLTPHIAGVTIGAFRDMLLGALANIGRVLAHQPPENVVNGVASKNKG
jgi:lactate dehydrogenase-like 2-hydroxyacid dehydrogenase